MARLSLRDASRVCGESVVGSGFQKRCSSLGHGRGGVKPASDVTYESVTYHQSAPQNRHANNPKQSVAASIPHHYCQNMRQNVCH